MNMVMARGRLRYEVVRAVPRNGMSVRVRCADVTQKKKKKTMMMTAAAAAVNGVPTHVEYRQESHMKHMSPSRLCSSTLSSWYHGSGRGVNHGEGGGDNSGGGVAARHFRQRVGSRMTVCAAAATTTPDTSSRDFEGDEDNEILFGSTTPIGNSSDAGEVQGVSVQFGDDDDNDDRDDHRIADEDLPLVALVGRPNVGKSAMFNRLVGRERAVVHDMPGVTRDRLYERAEWDGREFMLVDTGGIARLEMEEGGGDWRGSAAEMMALPDMVERQSAQAVMESDVVVLIVDGQAGLTPPDVSLARWLRELNKPVVLAVNKCESPVKGPMQVLDFYELGFDVHGVSAISGTGTGDMLDHVMRFLPDTDETLQRVAREDDEPLRVAIVGRPNVGKSSLLNKLAGEERCVVNSTAGTTRDAIDTKVVGPDGRTYVLVDTAGIRRRTRVLGSSDKAEKLAVESAMKALRRADIVAIVLDASDGPTDQDLRLMQQVTMNGKGLVLVINKWDLVPNKDSNTLDLYEKALKTRLFFATWSLTTYTSALSGQRVQKILETCAKAGMEHRRRIPTATLNRVLQDATMMKQPPSKGGKRGRIYYCTQAATRPPTFVFFVNSPKLFDESYRKYLERNLRENIGFEGTPIRLLFRGKAAQGSAASGGMS